MNTIILILRGGLGNQMFQYACAKGVAKACNANLILDASSFESDPLRNYMLDYLDIKLEKQTREQFWMKQLNTPRRFIKRFAYSRLHKKYDRVDWVKDGNVQKYDFAKHTNSLLIMDGYFQNYDLFERHGVSASELFEFKTIQSDEPIRQSIDDDDHPTVFVNIRRTDYVNHPIHGVCTDAYYQTSIEHMRACLNDPRFYFVSDDIHWCAEHYKANDFIHIEDGEVKEIRDMLILTHCQHGIMSNSSYSFWGAYLNIHQKNDAQIMLVPSKWYRTDDHDFPSPRLPDRWKQHSQGLL